MGKRKEKERKAAAIVKDQRIDNALREMQWLAIEFGKAELELTVHDKGRHWKAVRHDNKEMQWWPATGTVYFKGECTLSEKILDFVRLIEVAKSWSQGGKLINWEPQGEIDREFMDIVRSSSSN